jgi:Arc/MetJ-type ribon-helix-helix transcriptional regulator
MTNMNVDMPDGMLAEMEELTKRQNARWATISEITRAALRDFLDKEKERCSLNEVVTQSKSI